ncbi:MAG: MBOAT family protein [Gemmiger sp.]|nr:MBOAT family protein [Gemmiger sp.]
MTYLSPWFLLAFPLAVASYWVAPVRLRSAWLLGLSWLYMASWGGASVMVLLLITLATYLAGRGLAASRSLPLRRVLLAVGLCCCAGFLAARKLVGLFSPGTALVAAAGLSFYALQAASYLIDVYRGTLAVEKNLLHYALYIAFFPRILSGPIGRAGDFLPQLAAENQAPFSPARAVRGLQWMLWGYLEKLVVANTLGVVVDTVYAAPTSYSGTVLVVATILFAFQLYADFAGYSHLAIGGAEVLGFTLAPNFRQPYLATSLADFWRRWHISLSSWLLDYIYIPLGGSRRGRVRKYANLLVTFLVSGLWHGTGLHYLFWGALHAGYQTVAGLLPHRPAAPTTRAGRWLRRLWVVALVDFAWLFFRAPSLRAGFGMLGSMVTRQHPAELWNGTLLTLGLSAPVLGVALAALALVLGADWAREQGHSLQKTAATLALPVRWAAYLALILLIALFAARTVGANAAGFYYAIF